MKIDWVDDKMGISGAIDDYDELIRNNVKAVINLRSEMHDDVLELSKRGIAYYWMPIVDNLAPSRTFHIPIFYRILEETKENRVLIHCTQGMGRSACFVIMYLMDKMNISSEDAYKHLKKVRPIVNLTKEQRRKINKYKGYEH
jgi:protein-tyrosine phosphatase